MKFKSQNPTFFVWVFMLGASLLCVGLYDSNVLGNPLLTQVRFVQHLFASYSNFSNDSTQNEITITAVGDVMIGSAYPSEKFLPPNDGKNSFSKVLPYLKGDVVFGNLEGVLLDTGQSLKCRDTSKACYAFRMPERYVEHLKNAGFNVFSMANNHVNDFKRVGMLTTQNILKANGISYAGTVGKPYTIFKIKDGTVKVGFCAFAPNLNTMDLNNKVLIQRTLKRLRAESDIVVVSFHGGAEGVKHEHVPKKMELFYHEKRGDVHAFAHLAIDAGADLVLGHGPHVLRAVELYKNKFIVYSMGNFCTYGQFNLTGAAAFAPIFNIRLTSKGDFLNARVVSAYQTHKGLRIDTLQRAFRKIQQLTVQDFPNGKLKFHKGLISRF